MEINVIERGINGVEFLGKPSQVVANAIKIYCKTIEI